MKRYVTLFLTFSLVILFYSMPSIVKAESTTEWKLWPSKLDVKVYKEWEITFSEAVDYNSLTRENIMVVRERDNKIMAIDPFVFSKDYRVVKLGLDGVYDFNETYYVLIKDVQSKDGAMLKEQVKIKFQTEKVDFDIEKTKEQDGLKFESTLGQTVDNLYVKVKMTNVSKEIIPYWGSDGCDRGLSSSVVSKGNLSETIDFKKWTQASFACNQAFWQYYLKPDETIEIFDVFYLPEKSLYENNYLELRFKRGMLDNRPSINPLEIKIPIELK